MIKPIPFQIAVIILLSFSQYATATSAIDILENPKETGKVWERKSDKGYICENDIGATLTILKFKEPIQNVPKLSRLDKQTGQAVFELIGPFVIKQRPFDTIVVLDNYATRISTLAERSFIGISEDSTDFFQAGHYKAITSSPMYNSDHIGSHNFTQKYLIKAGNILVQGISLDKTSGLLTTRIHQNSSDPGTRPFYDIYEDQFFCEHLEGTELGIQARSTGTRLLQSMAQIKVGWEKRFVDKRKTTSRVVAEKNDHAAEPEELRVSAIQTAEAILNHPNDFAAKLSTKAQFFLSCTNDHGEKFRIVRFSEPLNNFPKLEITDNENELKRSGDYSTDRLSVEVKVRKITNKANSVIVFEDQVGDEIYGAGLSFVARLYENDDYYESGRATQLRSSSAVPSHFRPKLSNELKEFSLGLKNIKVDRVDLTTNITLSWTLVPHRRIQYNCKISHESDEDTMKLLKSVMEALRIEKKRLTKVGLKRKI